VKRRKTKGKQAGRVYGKNGVFYSFSGDDPGQIQIKIDFKAVAPPDAYYYADSLYVRMDEEQHMAILSFGHRNENEDKFSNRIDVAMPAKSLMGLFWASSRPVEATLDKLLETYGPIQEIRPVSPPRTRSGHAFRKHDLFGRRGRRVHAGLLPPFSP
jgi:hypothetical protein